MMTTLKYVRLVKIGTREDLDLPASDPSNPLEEAKTNDAVFPIGFFVEAWVLDLPTEGKPFWALLMTKNGVRAVGALRIPWVTAVSATGDFSSDFSVFQWEALGGGTLPMWQELSESDRYHFAIRLLRFDMAVPNRELPEQIESFDPKDFLQFARWLA